VRNVGVTLLISLAMFSASAAAQTQDDRTAIREVILDYVDGWWAGDVTRMEGSLHPDLVKRIVFEHEATGRSMLNTLSKNDMVEHTRAGGGSAEPEQKGEVEVSIVAVSGGIASAIATSARYVDYLHLAKWNGRWVIVNVLWGMR
jgi:hypothetical protein